MTASNYDQALAFVWAPGRDDPADGYHVTPGDPGGGTFGGVIEATWDHAVHLHVVTGALRHATRAQLSAVLRQEFWGEVCDALPSGLDFLVFNGRMMSGEFPKLFQQCLGLMGPEDVDGCIGPETLAAVGHADRATLIAATAGSHHAYLANLPTWSEFGHGWTARLKAAKAAALALSDAAPVA